MGVCFYEPSQIVDIYYRDKGWDTHPFYKPHGHTNVVKTFWFDLLLRHALISIRVGCVSSNQKERQLTMARLCLFGLRIEYLFHSDFFLKPAHLNLIKILFQFKADILINDGTHAQDKLSPKNAWVPHLNNKIKKFKSTKKKKKLKKKTEGWPCGLPRPLGVVGRPSLTTRVAELPLCIHFLKKKIKILIIFFKKIFIYFFN